MSTYAETTLEVTTVTQTTAELTTVGVTTAEITSLAACVCLNQGILNTSSPCSCICLPQYTGPTCETVLCDQDLSICPLVDQCANPDFYVVCPNFCKNPACVQEEATTEAANIVETTAQLTEAALITEAVTVSLLTQTDAQTTQSFDFFFYLQKIIILKIFFQFSKDIYLKIYLKK